MTADNLTFSIEIDFIPDIQDGRAELKKSMKSVSEKFDGTYILDPKARPIISGLSKDDVEGALKELGLLAFGTWPACILTATIVFFLVFLNTYSGVRAVDREQLEILRLMGAREHHLITKVVFPSAIQWVFTGLKLSVPYALIGAIVGEIMASNRGLGYLLQDAAGQLDTAGVFAALVAIIALALLLQAIVRMVETRLMPWKKDLGDREASV